MVRIRVPPLRERPEDIPILAEHFLAKYTAQMGKTIASLSPEALALLNAYNWPGNIRELENAIERAVALERSATILPESLPPIITGVPEALAGAMSAAAMPLTAGERGRGPSALPDAGFDLEQHVQHIEREYIAEALRRAGGVKVRAAELLGMSFRSFRYYMKKYNLK